MWPSVDEYYGHLSGALIGGLLDPKGGSRIERTLFLRGGRELFFTLPRSLPAKSYNQFPSGFLWHLSLTDKISLYALELPVPQIDDRLAIYRRRLNFWRLHSAANSMFAKLEL